MAVSMRRDPLPYVCTSNACSAHAPYDITLGSYSIVEIIWGKNAVAPNISQTGKLRSRRYMGLCRLWLRTMVTTIIKLEQMIVRYVIIDKIKAGTLEDALKLNEGKVKIVELDELRYMTGV